MNNNYSFDRCLNNMSLNLEIIEELENALSELGDTISTGRCPTEQPSGTSDHELQAVAA